MQGKADEVEVGDWRGYLTDKKDKGHLAAIRMSAQSGRPCGDEGFMSTMEGMFKRKFNPRGRPRKKV